MGNRRRGDAGGEVAGCTARRGERGEGRGDGSGRKTARVMKQETGRREEEIGMRGAGHTHTPHTPLVHTHR